MSRTLIFFHVYIVLDLPITDPKGRVLMQVYRVVPETKTRNFKLDFLFNFLHITSHRHHHICINSPISCLPCVEKCIA